MVRDGIYYALGFTAAGIFDFMAARTRGRPLPLFLLGGILRVVFSRPRAARSGGSCRRLARRRQSRRRGEPKATAGPASAFFSTSSTST